MPAERVTMRKINDILRLKWACGLSNRQVEASCGVARSTVAETLYRATAAGLSWPFLEDLDDQQLETRLYPPAPCPTAAPRAMPDWATVHQELARKCLQVVETERSAVLPFTGLILERPGEGRGEERSLLAGVLPDRRLDVPTSQCVCRLFGQRE